MSLSTFFIGLGIVSVLAIIVRAFWLELFVIWVILRALFWIVIASTVSTIGWMVLVEGYRAGPIDGFGLTWIFFFVTFSLVFIIGVLIAIDIFTHFKDFIQDLFRK
jgi:hypothetical protein